MKLGDRCQGKKSRALRSVTVTGVRDECAGVRTLFFEDDIPISAGQFFMVWVPGGGEIPISASIISPGNRRGVTVADVGYTTHALNTLKDGDTLHIEGPYGSGFRLTDDWLWVGGGVGASPIVAALSGLVEKELRNTVVLGASTSHALVLKGTARELIGGNDRTGGADASNGAAVRSEKGSLHICTDDGSEGFSGLASQLAHTLILERKAQGLKMYRGMAACGPEPMMLTLLELARLHGLPCQFSLERFMRCGVGICDSCSIDGLQVCRDGPVFTGEVVSELGEFGRFTRDPSGRKVRMGLVSRRSDTHRNGDSCGP